MVTTRQERAAFNQSKKNCCEGLLLPEAESDYLVAQLSGYQQTGKVPQQLTSHKTALEQRLWHTQAVHHLLQLIMYGGNYPALQTLVWPYLEKI